MGDGRHVAGVAGHREVQGRVGGVGADAGPCPDHRPRPALSRRQWLRAGGGDGAWPQRGRVAAARTPGSTASAPPAAHTDPSGRRVMADLTAELTTSGGLARPAWLDPRTRADTINPRPVTPASGPRRHRRRHEPPDLAASGGSRSLSGTLEP